MRRALGLGLALAALAASPAGAAAPAPTILDFEDQAVGALTQDTYPGGPAVLIDGDTGCGHVAASGGNFGPRYLEDACPVRIGFGEAQASVGLFTRASDSPQTFAVIAFDAQGTVIDQRLLNSDARTWTAVALRHPAGTAAITRVDVGAQGQRVDLDDVGFSPSPQPDVDITGGPGSGDPTFTFGGNQDGMTFFCKLDGGASEPCSSPKSYPGLADGGHTFEVIGRDRWGVDDATPPQLRFVVSRAVPVADRDADGVPDGADNCPDDANAGQGDSDADGVGDACELLPSGNTPTEAGKVAKVELLSGEVFVKLPAGATGSAFTGDLRVPFQSGGFLPLKGVAAVPIGSTLDTRAGEVSVTAAVNGQPARSRRQLRREARFRAGIFAIRQARKARRAKRSKRIPPRAELASPAGAERPCRASGPAKGIAVRSLVTNAKGVFRTVGGAATATPAKGTSTFITTDRCDGTVTEVGRGRVAVIAKRSGKRAVVRAGRAYIVRARLFAARKGRRGP